MTVEHLSEVRSVARARAQEDFDYFAQHVLGLHGPVPERKYVEALAAWEVVCGRGEPLAFAPTETFQWLFAECVERRAA